MERRYAYLHNNHIQEMENIKNGIIKISEELVITPQYSFSEFKKTSYYNGQEGVRTIWLNNMQMISGRNYKVNLFFRNEKIYMVSLVCCDKIFDFSEEFKRKEIHDDILRDLNIMDGERFAWGRIVSDYDKKSNISSIDIIYGKRSILG